MMPFPNPMLYVLTMLIFSSNGETAIHKEYFPTKESCVRVADSLKTDLAMHQRDGVVRCYSRSIQMKYRKKWSENT